MNPLHRLLRAFVLLAFIVVFCIVYSALFALGCMMLWNLGEGSLGSHAGPVSFWVSWKITVILLIAIHSIRLVVIPLLKKEEEETE